METLEFYVIRRKDGRYLVSKRQWGEGLKKAKIYTKKGACGQVTAWADELPDNEIPVLIPLVATLGEPIDQTERVMKSRRAKELKEAMFRLARAKSTYDKARMNLARAKLGYYENFSIIECEDEIKKLETKVKELSTK